jgi:hypothetical protein
MEINRQEIESKFRALLEKDKNYKRAMNAVYQNSNSGKIYLIGGQVYRRLINIIHGTNEHNPPKDYDFVVENPKDEIEPPFGWTSKKNLFGNPNFIRIFPLIFVDFIPSQGFRSRVDKPEPITIEDYLSSTPLDIQSIAYDPQTGELKGEKSFESIRAKTVSVNSIRGLEEALKMRRHETPEDYIVKVARTLNFSSNLRIKSN